MGANLKQIIRQEYSMYKTEIDSAIKRVFEHSNFILGEEVELFEKEFADYMGVKYAISCGSGTDALILTLLALNLEQGTKVGVPMHCFGAVAEAVWWNNCEIVFYDNNDPHIDYNIKYLIVAHLFNKTYGNYTVAAEAYPYVIEDFSQAIGVFFPKNEDYFNIGICSFHPTKNLSCYGDGGAIITDDEFLAEKLRMLRNHGQREKYNYQYVGMNSRLDTIQAAVLRVKLKHIDEILELRKDVYKDFSYPRPLNRYEPYFEL